MQEKQPDECIRKESDTSTEQPNRDYAGAANKSDPEEIKLVRKLDLLVIVSGLTIRTPNTYLPTHQPIIWFLCFMSYLNRQAITVARLDNLEKDLGMKGTEFSTSISIHYVGYICGQIPSNMLLTRLRPSWYLSIVMMMCGLVTGLTAICHDFKGIVLQRFFQGVLAAPMYPGALYVLSLFYTRKELGTRMTIIYTSNMVATALSGTGPKPSL